MRTTLEVSLALAYTYMFLDGDDICIFHISVFGIKPGFGSRSTPVTRRLLTSLTMAPFSSFDSKLSLKERRLVLSFVDDTFDNFMSATSLSDLSSEEASLCLDEFWRKVKNEFSQASSDKRELLRQIFNKALAIPLVEQKQARRLQEAFDKMDPSVRETGKQCL